MTVGRVLEVAGGIAALLTVLEVLGSIDARDEPEGTASFAMAFTSLPLAVVTVVLLAATALLHAWFGALRRALILGILATLAAAGGWAWLASLR
jgi:hypothetical protein